MRSFVFGVLLVCPALGVPAAASPSEKVHQAMVRRYLPLGALADSVARETWPWVQHVAPLWAALEHGREDELRRYYMGVIYGTPQVERFCGYERPVQNVVPMPRPSLPQSRLDELDCIIVGSGPAGSVLGHQLTEAGWRVAILDQGPLVLPGTVDTRQLSALKEHGGARPTADGSVLVRTAQAVGGGSAVNIDLALSPTLPFIRERLERWHQAGLYPFDSAQVARADRWVQAQIGTRQVPADEMNTNNEVLWRGATALGLQPRLFALNTFAPGTSTWPTTDKRSNVEALLLPAMQKGMAVLPDMQVKRIVFEGSRAVGVEAVVREPWDKQVAWADPWGLGLKPGSSMTLRARRIVLCAGAQGSAALLLEAGLPAGRGVVLHPVVPLVARMATEIRNERGTPSSVYVPAPGVVYECSSGEPAYVAQALWGAPAETQAVMKDYPHLAGFGVMLVDHSSSANRVVLHDGKPLVEYALTPDDARRLRAALETAVRMFFAAGASEVYLPTDELPWRLRKPQSLAAWKFTAGHTLVTSAHMQSTCKIGSVVDVHGRVVGKENLYVVDSSIFPESVGANPMQTIYATAFLFAESWIERL